MPQSAPTRAELGVAVLTPGAGELPIGVALGGGDVPQAATVSATVPRARVAPTTLFLISET